jgi:hypothetical protein
MLEKAQPSTAEAGDSGATVNVELGALAVELGLSDVAAVPQERRVGEAPKCEGRLAQPGEAK